MNPTLWSRPKAALAVLALAVLAFGTYATRHVFRQAYNGFVCTATGEIVKVFERGPAETAGFRVGDVIASLEGVDFKDVRARTRLPVPKIGDTVTFVVERQGAKHTLSLTHSAPPARDLGLAVAHTLIGLCFLILGFVAYLRLPTRSTLLLAVIGVCFGVRLMTLYFLPGSVSPTVMMAWFSGFEAAGFLGLAASLHLALAFPRPSPLLRSKAAVWVIYLPAIAVSLLMALLNTALPDATPVLMNVVNAIYGLCWVVYLLAVALVLLRTYWKAGREDRAALGLNAMVVGTVIGVVPLILLLAMLVLAPTVWLPGSEFYGLSAILIPFSWSAGVLKAEKKLAALPAN